MSKKIKDRTARPPLTRKSANHAAKDEGAPNKTANQNDRHKEDFEQLLDDAVFVNGNGRKK